MRWSAALKMVASGSWLTATIALEVFIPAACWIAPEMPHAMYLSGVSATACKDEDANGSLGTPRHQVPIPGSPVNLSIGGVRQTPGKVTGAQGCFTWLDLEPEPSRDVE
jgi:hypothetical protein